MTGNCTLACGVAVISVAAWFPSVGRGGCLLNCLQWHLVAQAEQGLLGLLGRTGSSGSGFNAVL